MSDTATVAVPGIRRLVLGPWHPWAMVRSSLTWRAAVYLVTSLGFGLAWFTGPAVGLTLPLALAVFWVGIPLLALMMLLWRGAAMFERRLLRVAFGVTVPDPYRPVPRPAGLLAEWRAMAADPTTWKDLLYLGPRLPVALVEFTVSVAVWSAAGVFLAAPVLTAVEGAVVVNFGTPLFTRPMIR